MQAPITVQLIESPGGLADCPGFKLAAVACDIRQTGDKERLDLALLAPEEPCKAAGVFTQNDLCAAPVLHGREILQKNADAIGGCVINSGNANAATGQQGVEDNEQMAARAQSATHSPAPFLVCSTGRIGRQLPMEPIESGIDAAAAQLNAGPQESLDAADAILTSDTRRKLATARFQYGKQTVTVAGMAKGAGMIEPDMATMLAFLATDIDASATTLHKVLKDACDQSFNCITVDGDMSTNDTVLLLANGKSQASAESDPALLAAFEEAVRIVCQDLAEKIVGDGEKVTKLVELQVVGCKTATDAEKVARAVGNSLLVKTSWYGSDPNWGRLADAAGYARVGLDPASLDIDYDDVPALIAGSPQDNNLPLWKSIVSKDRFRIKINLNQGNATYRLLASDLSEAYVDFNKSE
ncbi:MAG: bifunctional glutamate N-acetyltransferase/amino-acid acetyltransferase ArgJ [Coraliomargaritaceae bacterium]